MKWRRPLLVADSRLAFAVIARARSGSEIR
jgi:hypothetical protein